MYENRYKALLPRHLFLRRVIRHFLMGFTLVILSLGIGMLGYGRLEHMDLPDSFVNAAMILSGMGPVAELKTVGGKVFAGVYALFSGLTFIILLGVILAPVIHRALHKFHLEDSDLESKSKKKPK